MTDDLQVRVPTKQLLTLLERNPETMVRLESMACEKIAQEIMRKATSADLKKLTESTVSNAMAEVSRAMRNSSAWPPDVRKAVEALANEHLKQQRVAMINEFRDEVNKLVSEAIEGAKKILADQANDMFVQVRDNMAEVARESFFEVLKEARGA